MSNLSKFKQLSSNDRRLLSRAVLLLPVIHVALFVLGYARLRAVMERLAPLTLSEAPGSETASVQHAREIARLVSIAAQQGLYKATCLRRSLLAWWLLRRDGIQSKICFGVRMLHEKLEAHAWVEVNGVIINDSARVCGQYQTLREALPVIHRGL